MSEKSEANPPYRRPKLGEMSISFRSRDGSHMTSMSLVDILRAKAEAGDATAQFELGCMLLEGKRTEADPAAARSWFGKAAQAGHVRLTPEDEGWQRRHQFLNRSPSDFSFSLVFSS